MSSHQQKAFSTEGTQLLIAAIKLFWSESPSNRIRLSYMCCANAVGCVISQYGSRYVPVPYVAIKRIGIFWLQREHWWDSPKIKSILRINKSTQFFHSFLLFFSKIYSFKITNRTLKQQLFSCVPTALPSALLDSQEPTWLWIIFVNFDRLRNRFRNPASDVQKNYW